MPNKMLLHETFSQLLDEIQPEKLLLDQCQLNDGILQIQHETYDLGEYKNIYLLGSGKAVLSMAKAMQTLLSDYAPETLLVGPYALDEKLHNTTYIQSTHPLPSEKSMEAALALKTMMQRMEEHDLYIYLLSGGSSALIELLPEAISLESLQRITELMLHSGMPIEEMNSVRKALSLVKGGKLAGYSKAQGCVLVLSDVLGNDLEVIGSAPLYVSQKPQDPVAVLQAYDVFDKVPKEVQQFLLQADQTTVRLPKEQVQHFIMESNETVLQKADEILKSRGMQTALIDFKIEGDVKDVAQRLYQVASQKHTQPLCYIGGGEATVVVKGVGKGGRNQHLALHFLNLLPGDQEITFLSAATDGVDGNSDAAGAIVDAHTHAEALAHGLDMKHYLEYFDSNAFFSQLDALVVSGPTHNNLLDIVLMIVEPRIKQGAIYG